jgi:hypothetical protein
MRDISIEVEEAASLEPPPAAVLLSRGFGLSPFERNVLLLSAATELDERIPSMIGAATGDPGQRFPTFGLAVQMFPNPAWDVLSPERPLLFWRLVDIDHHENRPLTSSPIRPDQRIVAYLKGLNYMDERLRPMVEPLEEVSAGEDVPASQHKVVDRMVHHLDAAAPEQRVPVLQLVGPFEQTKKLLARHLATRLGVHLFRMPASVLPAAPEELESIGRLWSRETMLVPVALYLEEADGVPSAGYSPVTRFLSQTGGLVALSVRHHAVELGSGRDAFEVAKPTPTEQRSEWLGRLGVGTPPMADQLAGQFNFDAQEIARIVEEVSASGPSDSAARDEALWASCRARTRPHMESLAQRVEAKANWRDIVLPPAELSALERLSSQVRARSRVYDNWGYRDRMNRGFGITALFAGESGTGKTMAAEVIANELSLDLYRIDLSAVVDKYIGETEKNLRRLFDAAEDGGAILFFDEADALFGKRSEVKDSHDRYANIEINYLLQRMEGYRGLAILATNLKDALDKAFLRRIRFLVNFPFPDESMRLRMWQGVFPEKVPLGQLDNHRLASFRLTGGHIHNAALCAAFLAADGGTEVTMPLVLDAIRQELRKLDRPINDADFRWNHSSEGTAA